MSAHLSPADELYDQIGTRIYREEFREIYGQLVASGLEGFIAHAKKMAALLRREGTDPSGWDTAVQAAESYLESDVHSGADA